MASNTRLLIRPRERDAIIQSLRFGVTPRIGLQHIQVGRVKEVEALHKDIERISDGGAAFRFIIGDFGSGKSFFLQLMRSIALEKGLVTVHADLSPEKRFFATGGQARAMYAELMCNLSTRAKPDGEALVGLVERFITEARRKAEISGSTVESEIKKCLTELDVLEGGFEFSCVIKAYWHGHESGNDVLKSDAIRWLRGEFTTKTDAKKALGVSKIIDDANVYIHLKLMSLFVRQAGYKGLLVNIDEMVNIYKLANAQARRSNYEKMLNMLNDCLQGNAKHIGFFLGGTNDFLLNERKGVFSYEALKSRLEENRFAAAAGIIDYSEPILKLNNLAPEELFILLKNLRHVFAGGDKDKYLVPDEALKAFLEHCNNKIGDAYFRTPRHTIKEFLGLLATLEQGPGLRWTDLIEHVRVEAETDEHDLIDFDSADDKEELTTFTL